MKQILPVFSLAFILLFLSCKSKINDDFKRTGENLKAMTGELGTKFPGNTLFQSIMFSFDEILGNTILVKIAGNPDSLKIQEWFYINGMWEMSMEKIMEADSLKFTDHFFSAKNEYNLSQLTEILAKSSEKLKEEKNQVQIKIKSINLSMGNQAFKKSKLENLITQVTVESPDNQKRFLVNFNADGSYISITEE